MPMKLFHWPPSAPSRCAYLTLKTLGLEFEVKMIDLSEKEQYSPEFLSVCAILKQLFDYFVFKKD